MGTVTMDLQELKALKNKVEEVKQQAEKDKKQLQEKIDKLQQEKEIFIANQKRVIFTRKQFDIKQYLPCTQQNLRNLFEQAIAKTQNVNVGFFGGTEYVRLLYKDIQNYIETHSSFETNTDLITPIKKDKEEEYEFINLDDAIKLALNQEDSNYMVELKQLKLKNSELNKRIIDYDIDKEKEINTIVERENERYKNLEKISAEKYKKLSEESNKKYEKLAKESEDKYTKLQQEFAKYKDDEQNMSLKDKLEKYQKENVELKQKLERLESKSNKTGFFGFLFK